MIKWLKILVVALLGGVISRFHGGGFKGGVNKTLKNFLWALPHCIVIGILNPWLAPLGLINMLKATGHGRGLGADEPLKETAEPEKIEFLTLWLQPSLHDRAYKFIIMALTGLAAVLGTVIAFLFISPIGALAVAICGLLKGVAYEIGARLLPNQNKSGIPHVQYKTEVGEVLTGVFAYGGLTIATILSI